MKKGRVQVNIIYRILIITILILVTTISFAKTVTLKCKSDIFWNNNSVVYAEVLTLDNKRRGYADMTIQVKATLCGTLDPAKHENLTLPIRWGLGSVIKVRPDVNDRIVVLLMKIDNDKLIIPNAYAPYSPNRSTLIIVKKFDDPVVEEVQKKLRKLRKNDKQDKDKKRALKKEIKINEY